MSDPFHLHRFVDAQDRGDTYRQAVAELEAGQKRSHWMWFVFPQVAGLGHSQTAQLYAISGREEAEAYLDHPVLGGRLVEAAQALLALGGNDPVGVLGGTDAQKLRSSMTLFGAVRPAEPAFRRVLDQYFDGSEDEATLSRL
jgi:uncharacterized protein (DUF1810 family)